MEEIELTFDLETAPSQSPELKKKIQAPILRKVEQQSAELAPPGNLKDPVKIAAWEEQVRPAKVAELRQAAAEKAAEAYQATSLNGAFGHVAVICYAFDDGPVQQLWERDWLAAESRVLSTFFAAYEAASSHGKVILCGDNIIGFDLRMLFQRAVVLNIRPPKGFPFQVRPWETDRVRDNMVTWAGVRGYVSQDEMCHALGIPTKHASGMTGKDVWPALQQGRIVQVAAYCEDDVNRSRAIRRRLNFLDLPPETRQIDGFDAKLRRNA